MPNRFLVTGGGGLWGSTASWSDTNGGPGGFSIPTAADDVFLTASSPACNVNTTGFCLSINFTGYVETITMTSSILVVGSVTLSPSMSVTGSSALIVTGTGGTMTSNGFVWPNTLAFNPGGTATITVADTWNVTGTVNLNAGIRALTINGGQIRAGGDLLFNQTTGTISGTTALVMNGTGSLTSTGTTGTCSLGLNIDTAGTVTMSGTIRRGGATTYTAGTVVTTGSTYVLSANATMNAAGINWNNVTFTSGFTTTLGADLNIFGTATFNPTGILVVDSTIGRVNFHGPVNFTSTTAGTVRGTAVLALVGNVTVSGTHTATGTATIQSSVRIEAGTNTVSFGSGFQCNFNGPFTYVSGSMSMDPNATFRFRGATIAASGMTLGTAEFSGASVTNTLSENVNCVNLIAGRGTGVTACQGSTIQCSGNYTDALTTGSCNGTTVIVLGGSGTITSTAATGGTIGGVSLTVQVNTAGSYDFSAISLRGSMGYISGTFNILPGSILQMAPGSSTVALNVPTGFVWQTVRFQPAVASTIILTNTITVGDTISFANANIGLTFSTGNIIFTGTSISHTGTTGTVSGPSTLVINSTCSISQTLTTGALSMPITIDTPGTVTLATNLRWGRATLTHISGTVVTTGMTLIIPATTTTTTLNAAGIAWNNVTVEPVSATSNLSTLSDVTVNGNFTVTSTTFNLVTAGSFWFNVGGNFTSSGTTSVISGSTGVRMTGGGVVSSTISSGYVGIPLALASNVSFSGTFRYAASALTYESGTITTTGSTLALPINTTATVLNTAPVTWNNVTVLPSVNNAAITLAGDFNAAGTQTFTVPANVNMQINGGFRWFVSENLNLAYTGSSSVVGSATIEFNGNTVINSSGASGFLGTDVVVNGNVTLQSGTVFRWGSSTIADETFSHVSGTVVSSGAEFHILSRGLVSQVDTQSITWSAVSMVPTANSARIRLIANLNVSGTLSIGSNSNFTGFVIQVDAFNINAGGMNVLNTTSGDITIPFGAGGGIVLVGPGTVTTSQTAGGSSFLAANVTIQSSGTVTFSGTPALKFAGGALRYVSGPVNFGTSLVIANSTCSIDMQGQALSALQISTGTVTLLSDCTAAGNLTLGSGGANAIVLNGESLIAQSNVTKNTSSSISGNSEIVLSGTGTLTNSFAAGLVSVNLTIDAVSRTFAPGTMQYGGGTFAYVAGLVGAAGFGLVFSSSAVTLNTGSMVWDGNYSFTHTASNFTGTVSSDLLCTGTITVGNKPTTGAVRTMTFNGSNIVSRGSLVFNLGGISGGIFNATAGTSKFIVQGGAISSTMSDSGIVANDITLNPTVSSITGSGTIYTAGDMTFSRVPAANDVDLSSMTLLSQGTTVIDMSDEIPFAALGCAFIVTSYGTALLQLASDARTVDLVTLSGSQVTLTGPGDLHLDGSISGISVLNGTASPKNIVWTGDTGTSVISMTASNSFVNIGIVFDGGVNTLALTGTVRFVGPSTLRYVSGGLDTLSSEIVLFENSGVPADPYETTLDMSGRSLGGMHLKQTQNDSIDGWNSLSLSSDVTFAGKVIYGDNLVNVDSPFQISKYARIEGTGSLTVEGGMEFRIPQSGSGWELARNYFYASAPIRLVSGLIEFSSQNTHVVCEDLRIHSDGGLVFQSGRTMLFVGVLKDNGGAGTTTGFTLRLPPEIATHNGITFMP